MDIEEVRIVDLPDLRAISALGYGPSPETEAFEIVGRFCAEHGIDPQDGTHEYFGFNNPDPSPGSPNYGYEVWLTVAGEVAVDPDDEVEIKDVPGGRYAVYRFTGLQNIGEAWRSFVRWFEDSGHRPGRNWETCLEQLRTPQERPIEEWEFDLYLPVAE
jgi:DNA gyrase inhibitor GyrI